MASTLVPRQYFLKTLQHAETLHEQGSFIEEMSKSLEAQLARGQTEFVRQAGEMIQQHGQAMKVIVEQALQDDSCLLDTYLLVESHFQQAHSLYVEAAELIELGSRAMIAH